MNNAKEPFHIMTRRHVEGNGYGYEIGYTHPSHLILTPLIRVTSSTEGVSKIIALKDSNVLNMIYTAPMLIRCLSLAKRHLEEFDHNFFVRGYALTQASITFLKEFDIGVL